MDQNDKDRMQAMRDRLAAMDLQVERESELRKAKERAKRHGGDSEDELCTCGHLRSVHMGYAVPGAGECVQCPGDDKKAWAHPFILADQ